jgi:peptidoglycan/LPS O-acetylase OafA/YrhL
MFFVISGYCISATAGGMRNRAQPVQTYLVRRFRRIYPPYWAAILIYALIIVIVERFAMPGFLVGGEVEERLPWSLGGWQWLGNLTLTESWIPHVVGGSRVHFISSSWTLCYEEQFYLVVGVFLLLAPRRLFVASTILTSVLAVMHTCFPSLREEARGFFFDGQWFLFAAGIAVFYDINYANRIQSWLLRLLLVVCAALSICNLLFDRRMSAGFVFAILILLVHPWDAWLSSRRWLRPLVFCGTMCYSMYLIHEIIVLAISRGFKFYGPPGDLVVLLAVLPLCVAATIAAGWAFHVAVERRFLNKSSDCPPRRFHAEVAAEPAVISDISE